MRLSATSIAYECVGELGVSLFLCNRRIKRFWIGKSETAQQRESDTENMAKCQTALIRRASFIFWSAVKNCTMKFEMRPNWTERQKRLINELFRPFLGCQTWDWSMPTKMISIAFNLFFIQTFSLYLMISYRLCLGSGKLLNQRAKKVTFSSTFTSSFYFKFRQKTNSMKQISRNKRKLRLIGIADKND